MKLHQFLGRRLKLSKAKVLNLLACDEIFIDNVVARFPNHPVRDFEEIRYRDEVLQEALPRVYIILNKPPGILSATKDAVHQTVIDVIDHPHKSTLHLAGRLDRASSGLVILSNDGHWTQRLTEPGEKVEKVYHVGTEKPLKSSDIEAFEKGFFFHTEGITTLPAKLEILEPNLARVTLIEGRYHQIKRMFYRVDNRVVSLHRVQIGKFQLRDDLPEGAWRLLDPSEV